MSDVMLLAFYNRKALGVRYLETALRDAGYTVRTVFYKDFNSVHPKVTSEKELELLKQDIIEQKPSLIGLSVMSSMYLDTVYAIIEMVKRDFDIPIVCGGAFATMEPERLLERGVQFVARSDGEHSICELTDAVINGKDYRNIQCLCYMEDGKVVKNPIGGLLNDIDGYGLPTINCQNSCFINDDKLIPGDPQLDILSYEVIASRGCPFTCTYCCCKNLRELLPKGIKGVRTRSVKSVIDELVEAKKQCKHLLFVHFYDEIFPNLPGWVDEFVVEYKKKINLPFVIWSHPKMVDMDVIKKLAKVGLMEVTMGIQSGSEHIRRDIFHRYETQEDILKAVDTIQKAGVFWDTFDLMLQHPFETIEDIKDSYYMVKKFPGRYELQVHGLNFLPGTDIVPMAIEAGHYTKEELDGIMYAPMEEQFGTFWKRKVSRESDLWYNMIFCYQFKCFRKKIESFEHDPSAHADEIDNLYAKSQKLYSIRYKYRSFRIALKRFTMAVFK